MPAELDQMNPDMGAETTDMPAPEMGGDVIGLHNGEQDREGAMAKADLYKLANYSHKLFQQIQDEDQLEAWVQAKITKAADYIASVYHYLEYEMKFSEYGHHLDNSDTLSEGQKMRLKEMLSEAKDKMKDLKKSQAEKMKVKQDHKMDEGMMGGGHKPCVECGGTGMMYEEPKAVPAHVQSKVDKYKKLVKATKAAHARMDANNNGVPDDEESVDEEFTDKSKTGDTFKTRTGVATKTDTGMKHSNTSYHDDGEAEEKSGKGIKTHAKAKDAGTKKAEKGNDIKLPKHDKPTYGMKNSEKFDNRPKEKDVDESLGLGMYEAKKGTKNKKVVEEPNEGNEFSGELVKARAQHKDSFKVDGKTFPVKEAAKQTMSRAAKGHEKYGKEGMAALAKAGREGKNLDKIRDKYDKYDESIETNSKKPCPPMSHVKKMCQDGKSVSEICKMHPDCDHAELKQMVADCKSKMDEASMPMKKVNGKSVPAFAADGKGKHDLSKKKDVKETAKAMWRNVKETAAYMAEKKAASKNLPGNREKIDADHDGKIEKSDLAALRAGKKEKETVKESADMTRLRELTGRLNQNEKTSLNESSEVASIRALTKRLLG